MRIKKENIFRAAVRDEKVHIPLYTESVSAGFPSPAQDYVERSLDLNELCIRNAVATFFVRVSGDSMEDGGIRSGDILIVDRSIEPKHKDIVIAIVDGEFTVKCFHSEPDVSLVPLNSSYPVLYFSEESELELFGVVTFVIHSVRNR
ncbi:translesion error-prone DNA polymerase V autoproteolytic subunit [Desulfobotulus sp. H1]|uniref:Translesion error-prone DNA polymerase V autoproteolytic subunit n=1 Tax=Desulfobotulus pelophilus TaxID=2823377 RepID=A0ABT3N868_9BACT|nr:translesion error-prone DNA polymerase V autoproteolytic subunit [Desulfobotulus pelophilus]MCW7753644.1 translesion error-prone DNA polymerase V autoproteolytic subunit [Desulfobotulus pelophilus]